MINMSSFNQGKWHIWTHRPDRFDLVSKYIKEKVPEVLDLVCPSIFKKDPKSKKNLKLKRYLIYEYYLFLQYSPNIEEVKIWTKIKNNPFITSYLGPCKEEELEFVLFLRSQLDLKDVPLRFFIKDKVIITSGPFSDLIGIITDIDNEKITLDIELDGYEEKIKLVVTNSQVKKI